MSEAIDADTDESLSPWMEEYRCCDYDKITSLRRICQAREAVAKSGYVYGDKQSVLGLDPLTRQELVLSKLHPTVSELDGQQAETSHDKPSVPSQTTLRTLQRPQWTRTKCSSPRLHEFDPSAYVPTTTSTLPMLWSKKRRAQQARRTRRQEEQQSRRNKSRLKEEARASALKRLDMYSDTDEEDDEYISEAERMIQKPDWETTKLNGFSYGARHEDPDPTVDYVPRCFTSQQPTESVTPYNGTILSVEWRCTKHRDGQDGGTTFSIGGLPIISRACPTRIPTETLAVAYVAKTSNVDHQGKPALSDQDRTYLKDTLGLDNPQKWWWSGFESEKTTAGEKRVFQYLSDRVRQDIEEKKDTEASLDERDDLAALSFGLWARALKRGIENGQLDRISILPDEHTPMAVVDCGAYGNDNDFEPPATPSAIEAIKSVMIKDCYSHLLVPSGTGSSMALSALTCRDSMDEMRPSPSENKYENDKDGDSGYGSSVRPDDPPSPTDECEHPTGQGFSSESSADRPSVTAVPNSSMSPSDLSNPENSGILDHGLGSQFANSGVKEIPDEGYGPELIF